MRIFVGIKASKDIIERVSIWRKSFGKGFPIRFIDNKNLHITLIPPWNVDGADGIIKLLKRNIFVKPFRIEFNTIKFGPDKKRPNLIWVEGSVPNDLFKLKKEIEDTLGIKPQRKEFKLHLTIARFKYKDFRKFPRKKIIDKIYWEQIIESFCLLESKLFSKGAEYRVLREFKFGNK